MDGDTYVFEGERYYQPTGDGQGADLQPHTGIEIPLADVAGFPAGTWKRTGHEPKGRGTFCRYDLFTRHF